MKFIVVLASLAAVTAQDHYSELSRGKDYMRLSKYAYPEVPKYPDEPKYPGLSKFADEHKYPGVSKLAEEIKYGISKFDEEPGVHKLAEQVKYLEEPYMKVSYELDKNLPLAGYMDRHEGARLREHGLPRPEVRKEPEVVYKTIPYQIIGRHGLGFDHRLYRASGLRNPLTPKLLEPLGYRPLRKDMIFEPL